MDILSKVSQALTSVKSYFTGFRSDPTNPTVRGLRTEVEMITKELRRLSTPAPDVDLLNQNLGPNVRIPRVPVAEFQFYTLRWASVALRTVCLKVKQEIFRETRKEGWDWAPQFKQKCKECGAKFDEKVEACTQCHSKNFSSPDPGQKQIWKEFMKEANGSEQTGIEVLGELEDDFNTIDDVYLILLKDYMINPEGDELWGKVSGIMRGDPSKFRIVANDSGVRGGKYFVCPYHRGVVLAQPGACTVAGCNKRLHDVHYVETEGGGMDPKPLKYFIKGEVIHASKYEPSRLYGISPIYTLWVLARTLMLMDRYAENLYEKGRLKGVLGISADNMDYIKKWWDETQQRLRQDPHYMPVVAIESGEKGKGKIEFVKLIDSLKEMDYEATKRFLREQMLGLYGVSPIFNADLSTGGGLNNEGLQITVTDRTVDFGQSVYHDSIFPKLQDALGITDWSPKLRPSRENDEMAELQRFNLKVDSAEKMRQMGYEIELTEDGFKFSGEASPPQTAGGFGFGGGGPTRLPDQDSRPEPDNRQGVKNCPPGMISTPDNPRCHPMEWENKARMSSKFFQEVNQVALAGAGGIRQDWERLSVTGRHHVRKKLWERYGDGWFGFDISTKKKLVWDSIKKILSQGLSKSGDTLAHFSCLITKMRRIDPNCPKSFKNIKALRKWIAEQEPPLQSKFKAEEKICVSAGSTKGEHYGDPDYPNPYEKAVNIYQPQGGSLTQPARAPSSSYACSRCEYYERTIRGSERCRILGRPTKGDYVEPCCIWVKRCLFKKGSGRRKDDMDKDLEEDDPYPPGTSPELIAEMEAHWAGVKDEQTVIVDCPDEAKQGKQKIRVFKMIRENDESGISGTGHVATGIVFDDGAVSLHWITGTPSTTHFEKFEDFEKVHVTSHPGNKTKYKWLDTTEAEEEATKAFGLTKRCKDCLHFAQWVDRTGFVCTKFSRTVKPMDTEASKCCKWGQCSFEVKKTEKAVESGKKIDQAQEKIESHFLGQVTAAYTKKLKKLTHLQDANKKTLNAQIGKVISSMGSEIEKLAFQEVLRAYKKGKNLVGSLVKMGPPISTEGGKARMGRRLISIIPKHKVYDEPCLGGGSVFLKKEPAATTYLNDADACLVNFWKTIQKGGEEIYKALASKNWNLTEQLFNKLKAMDPTKLSPIDRAYRKIYLRKNSFRSTEKNINRASMGTSRVQPPQWLKTFERFSKYTERLKGATITQGDYKETIARSDGPDTFHFIDTPYDESFAKELVELLPKIKGKFLCTFSENKTLMKGLSNKEGINVNEIRVEHQGTRSKDDPGSMSSSRKELLITNYPVNVPKGTLFKSDDAPRDIVWEDLPFSKDDIQVLRGIYTENPFWQSFENMSLSLSEKLKEHIRESYEAPTSARFKATLRDVRRQYPDRSHSAQMDITYGRIGKQSLAKVIEKMKRTVSTEVYRLERIARSETTAVTAKGREIALTARDTEGDNRYDWFGPVDHRTSDQCKEIQKRVRAEGQGKGVPMDDLKQIMEDVVNEFNQTRKTNWDYRDWLPHANCRRVLRRVQ